jgi:hypothetical protein
MVVRRRRHPGVMQSNPSLRLGRVCKLRSRSCGDRNSRHVSAYGGRKGAEIAEKQGPPPAPLCKHAQVAGIVRVAIPKLEQCCAQSELFTVAWPPDNVLAGEPAVLAGVADGYLTVTEPVIVAPAEVGPPATPTT